MQDLLAFAVASQDNSRLGQLVLRLGLVLFKLCEGAVSLPQIRQETGLVRSVRKPELLYEGGVRLGASAAFLLTLGKSSDPAP